MNIIRVFFCKSFANIWSLTIIYPLQSHEKIKNALAYYLNTDSEKLARPFSTYYLPLDNSIAKLFYTLVWRELYGTDFPDTINPDDYEEDCGTEYNFSIYDPDPVDIRKAHPRPEYKEPSFANFIERLKQIQDKKLNS